MTGLVRASDGSPPRDTNGKMRLDQVGSVLEHYVIDFADCLQMYSPNRQTLANYMPPMGSRHCSYDCIASEGEYIDGQHIYPLPKSGPPYGRYYTTLDHCFITSATPTCSVLYSRSLSVVLIACNVCKVIVFCTLVLLPSFHCLVTIGDAVASF